MAEKPEETKDKDNKPWMIRDMPEYIRRKVKIFAVQHGMTVAQALEMIVNQSIPGSPDDIMQDPRGTMPTSPGSPPPSTEEPFER